MGLLDQFSNMNEDQTQGLLAAAAQMLQQSGPSRTPTSFGQIAGGGMMAYQGAMNEAKKRKKEEEQQRQMAEMRALQMQDMRGGLQDRDRARMLEQQIAGAARDSYRTPEQQASSLPGGSTIANAEQIPNMKGGFDTNAFVDRAMQINPLEGMKFRQQFAKQRELKETTNETVDGQTVKVNWFKDGSHEIVKGIQPRDELKLMSLGGKDIAYNPFALKDGQSFQRTQSPDSLANNAVSMRGQNMTDSRARDFNSVQADANTIKREEKKAVTDMTKAGQVASFDTMLGTLDRLSQHPGLSRSVGLVGKLPTMPGSDSANFQAELDTFQSQAFIPMVSQLKGMGALSDAEGKKLTAAVGALSPNMGETAFRQSVQRITDEMDQARARVSGQVARSGAQPARKSVMRGQVIDGYRFKGGDPADQNNWELK